MSELALQLGSCLYFDAINPNYRKAACKCLQAAFTSPYCCLSAHTTGHCTYA